MQTRLIRYATTLLFILLAAISGPQMLFAQTNTTALSGTITDASGAVVVGASVSISNEASGTKQSELTTSKGEFAFEQVQPGKYLVQVVATGFAEQDQTVELLVSTPKRLAVKLAVGTSEQTVTVEASLSEVNATDATLGKAFNSAQVSNLPYLANNITYLLSLQPGVLALDSGAQTGGLNQDARTGIVNGARQDQTNITLDGVDNNDQIFGYAFNGALRSTRDSVEEFRVTTTNANADAGRSSGAQVSLVTKSGTNTIHGSGYEYYRPPGTASNNFFNKQAQLNDNKPNVSAKVLEHTFGGSLGVPVLKNKLFFFGAYETFRQASSILVTERVPSILLPGGGHAGLITGNVTYLAVDPKAALGYSPKTLTSDEIAQLDGRSSDSDCADGGCIAPQTNAAAVAYFNSFPLANSNSGGDGYNTGSYSFTSAAPLQQNTNIARLDYNLTARQSFFVRGNLQSDNQSTPLQFPGLPAPSKVYGNNKGIAAGHIWSMNDHMTNNARYGFIRLGNGTRGTADFTKPYVSFSGFDTLQAETTTTTYAVTTNNFSDDFTYARGRHTIQGGVNFSWILNGQYFDSPLLAYANVSPNLLATAAIANQSKPGQPATLDPGGFTCADCGKVTAAFSNAYNRSIIANVGVIETSQSGTEFRVAGNKLVPQASGVVPTHTFKNFEQEYYLQDQWKATSHLTFTLGLRYVYLGVPYEKDGQQIAPTIALNTFLDNRAKAAAAGTADDTRVSFRASGSPNGQPNFWTPQTLNFAPRFAFAYATSDNKTAIHGGFSIAYDHFGEGVINSYQSNPQSLLSLSQTNLATFTNINTNPRFTGFNDVPPVQGATTSLALPYTPADSAFTFDYSINDKQKTPYAETFNLSIQHEFPHNTAFTAAYVGRLGRHLIQNLDVAMPTNLTDPISGQTYFQAATAFDKLVDQGIPSSAVPDSGYFHNVFPNFTSGDYRGAQAYYDVFSNNRGNETNALFQADTDHTTSPAGQSYRFFFPQTSSIYAQSTTGISNYHALQLSVRQALKSGLQYDLNYTFSKSMDEGSDPERNGTAGSIIINSFSPHQLYAPSDFDVRHNITANYTAPLPIGKGARFFNQNKLVDLLFGGFQLNGLVHYSTGFPFSAVGAGGWGTNFAFNSNMVTTGKIKSGGHHYDKATQSETALDGISSADALAKMRFAYVGESGERNNFRADGYFSVDDGLAKSFHVFREHQVRISAEVFNVLNTNRFNSAASGGASSPLQTDGTSSNFGTYTGGGAGLLVQPRQMQFSAKYIF